MIVCSFPLRSLKQTLFITLYVFNNSCFGSVWLDLYLLLWDSFCIYFVLLIILFTWVWFLYFLIHLNIFCTSDVQHCVACFYLSSPCQTDAAGFRQYSNPGGGVFFMISLFCWFGFVGVMCIQFMDPSPFLVPVAMLSLSPVLLPLPMSWYSVTESAMPDIWAFCLKIWKLMFFVK